MIKTLLIRSYFKGVSLYDSHFLVLFHLIILRTLKKTCRFIFFSFFNLPVNHTVLCLSLIKVSRFTCQSYNSLPVNYQCEWFHLSIKQ